jgi:hypothetical protein
MSRGALPLQDRNQRTACDLGVERVPAIAPPLPGADRHIDLASQACAGRLGSLIEGVTVRSADHEQINVRRSTALLPRVPGGPGTKEVGRLDAIKSRESSASTWRGPNERSSSSVSGPVRGESAAVTSRVFPRRREVITPVCSARASSRCADDTEPLARLASSVSVQSRPGASSTSVSSSACSRDRSNGSSGGDCTCITCNAHPAIGNSR